MVGYYIRQQCLVGRLLSPTLFIEIQVRQIEIIPKSDTGSWRLSKLDLLAPNGTSVKLSMIGLIGR